MSQIGKILAFSFMIIVLTAATTAFIMNKKLGYQNERLASLENQVSALQMQNKQFDALGQRIEDVAKENSVVKDELTRRESVKEKSQEELLTAAVAKASPSVVSIVISKDVPKLEIVYENPFGNDPFFKDFNFRVPVYRQSGTEYQKVGAGTGFLIRSTGYILTNRHVVEDTSADYTVLLASGAQKAAQVVYRDPNSDIAIVKIDGTGYSSEELGNSAILQLGQSVFAVGNALGEYSNSVSVGIISGLNRTIQAASASGTETLSGVIQTDAAINPGNSGGPLVDLNGKVIGINVATVVGSNNISFSIPINSVKSIINSVLK